MKETLICTLKKHNIYYLSDANCSFYILTPYKDYNETNISIRLKSNYQMYDLSKNPLEQVVDELVNYYKDIDNYNITLILPVFYDDILSRIRTVNDMEIYQKIDRYLGHIFNQAYMFLTKNNIKVKSNIYVINNDSFRNFTNWFVSRYGNRIEYKTAMELAKEDKDYTTLDVFKTPNINFVVGRNADPDIEATHQIEVETFDGYARNSLKEEEVIPPRKAKESAGYVSYILLGIITFGASLALLFLLVK